MARTDPLRALGDIAEVRTGFTFREKVEEIDAAEGTAHVAHIKDVRKAREATNCADLRASQLPTIEWQGKDRAFVAPGAVLLPARGTRGGYFQASCLVEDSASRLPVVVSSQFLIIKPRAGVLSAYLCWALNQPAMQHFLAEGASQGSSIVMLNTRQAKALKLQIPSLTTQHKILHLNRLWEQEQQLTQALLENREIMLQGMFQQLLKEKN